MCACFFPFGFLGCLVSLPIFHDVQQEGRGQRGDNFARQVLSVMIHHATLGGPQTGREEKATITVINREEGFPGTSVMRSSSCLICSGGRGGEGAWGGWEGAGEKKLKGPQMEVPKGGSFLFCPSDCCHARVFSLLIAQRNKTPPILSQTLCCC